MMKAQTGIEFMMLIGVMLTIVLIFVWTGLNTRQEVFNNKVRVEAQKSSDYIAFEINSAVKAGDGYQRKFSVDDQIFGVSDFTISVDEYSVFIDWSGKSVSSPIITENITGTIERGNSYIIKNIAGMINVTEV